MGVVGAQSGFIWNPWMGGLHGSVEHRHRGVQCSETVTLMIAV